MKIEAERPHQTRLAAADKQRRGRGKQSLGFSKSRPCVHDEEDDVDEYADCKYDERRT